MYAPARRHLPEPHTENFRQVATAMSRSRMCSGVRDGAGWHSAALDLDEARTARRVTAATGIAPGNSFDANVAR
jgi:hypothetical protein